MASAYIPPDTTAPVITVLGDNPLTLPVGSTFNDPGATALDAVDGEIAINASGSVNTAVPGSYTITYSATDAANNTATLRNCTIAFNTGSAYGLVTTGTMSVGNTIL